LSWKTAAETATALHRWPGCCSVPSAVALQLGLELPSTRHSARQPARGPTFSIHTENYIYIISTQAPWSRFR
jgi:hypothetical protein